MRAIILAGGIGKRLRPITEKIPKALVPINEKTILEKIIEVLTSSSIDNITIVTGMLGDKIRKKIGLVYGTMSVSYVIQNKPLGTADALSATKGKFNDENFLVCPCDVIVSKSHIKQLIHTHTKDQNDVTLSIKIMDEQEIHQTNMIEKKGKRVVRIIEKPDMVSITSKYGGTGIYVFNKKVFSYTSKIQLSKRHEFEIPDVVQLMINDGLKVNAVIVKKYVHLSDYQTFSKQFDSKIIIN